MSEKIINRVIKMLARANDLKGCSEEERDTALSMAYKTLAFHNLSMADLDDHTAAGREERVELMNETYGMNWCKGISNTISNLFFCKYLSGAKINATRYRHYFIGKESNAMTAMVMSDYVIKNILKQCRSLYRENLCPESRAFATGCADTLRHRVAQMKADAIREAAGPKSTTSPVAAGSDPSVPDSAASIAIEFNLGGLSAGRELVLANLYESEEIANEEFIATLGVETKEVKLRQTKVRTGAYDAGKEYGKNINLSLQVGGDVTPGPKRLPGK